MDGTLGEIRGFAGNFAPRNWNYCDGTLLSCANFAALFSILGTIYGGNGNTNFALPDLRGRIPVGQGQGPGLSNWTLGDTVGAENVALTMATMPAHTHTAALTGTTLTGTATPGCLNDAGGESSPAGNVMAAIPGAYAAAGDADSNMASINISINPSAIGVSVGVTGSGLPFSLVQPSLTINWIICLTGIYPSRN
jgi:microcystin-dependent protein